VASRAERLAIAQSAPNAVLGETSMALRAEATAGSVFQAMNERVHNFRLPIFNPCNAWLVLTDSVGQSRAARSDIFGPWDSGEVIGLCSYDDAGKFGLFFKRGEVDHELIAHEVFHLTVRMLEYCEVRIPHGGNHETHAYLCGYLTTLVYSHLAQWGEIINS
jgi:hypothetical protein